MIIVAIAWLYVVLLMSLAEAMSPRGGLLGALFTFVLYGVLPLAIVLYILATPARRRARRARDNPPPGIGD
jgi:Na+/serine symporter